MAQQDYFENLFAPDGAMSASQLSNAVSHGHDCIAALLNALGVLGELKPEGLHDATAGMLSLIALDIQRAMIEKTKQISTMARAAEVRS